MTTEKLVAAIGELAGYIDNGGVSAKAEWRNIVTRHALLPAPAAPPSPELRWPGVEVVQAEDGRYEVQTATHYIYSDPDADTLEWHIRSFGGDKVGMFKDRDAALSALNDPRTPPPPHVAEKPDDVPTRTFRQVSPGLVEEVNGREIGTLEVRGTATFTEPKPAEVWPRWFTSRDRDHRNGTHDLWRMTSPTEGRYWYGGHDSGASLYSVPQIESWSSIIELTPETCPALADARREWRERQGKASDDGMEERAHRFLHEHHTWQEEKATWTGAVKLAVDFAISETAALTAERDRLAAEVRLLEKQLARWKDSSDAHWNRANALEAKLNSLRAAKKPGRAKGATKRGKAN